MHADGRLKRDASILLTVTGDAQRYFSGESPDAVTAIHDVAGSFTLHRIDIEGDRGQVRVSLGRRAEKESVNILAGLRERLPDCELSFVSLDAAV
jgi:hypothetical protein